MEGQPYDYYLQEKKEKERELNRPLSAVEDYNLRKKHKLCYEVATCGGA